MVMRRVKIEKCIYLTLFSFIKIPSRPHSLNGELTQLNSHYCLRLIEIDLVLLIKTHNDKFKQAVLPSKSIFLLCQRIIQGMLSTAYLGLERLKYSERLSSNAKWYWVFPEIYFLVIFSSKRCFYCPSNTIYLLQANGKF